MKHFFGIIFVFSLLSFSVHASGRVLIIGESHIDDAGRDEFAKELKHYARMGYRYLALEMFNDNRQKNLDLFNISPDDHEQKILELLNSEWGYNVYSYLDLMREAHRQGIKIIGLDLPKDELPKEVDPYPVIPQFSLQMDARNKRMAQNISVLINKDRHSRILVLVGSYHAKSYAIPKYLTQMGHLFEVRPNSDQYFP